VDKQFFISRNAAAAPALHGRYVPTVLF